MVRARGCRKESMRDAELVPGPILCYHARPNLKDTNL